MKTTERKLHRTQDNVVDYSKTLFFKDFVTLMLILGLGQLLTAIMKPTTGLTSSNVKKVFIRLSHQSYYLLIFR